MMRALIKKEIFLNLRKVLLVLLMHGLFSLYLFQVESWNTYLVAAAMQIVILPFTFFGYEKKLNIEGTNASFPVTRSGIVSARYIVSAITIVFGLIAWLLFAVIWKTVWPGSGAEGTIIDYYKIALMLTIMFLYMAVTFPLLYRLPSYMGVLIITIVCLIGAIMLFTFIAHSITQNGIPLIERLTRWGAPMMILLFACCGVIPFIFSNLLSSKMYANIDLH